VSGLINRLIALGVHVITARQEPGVHVSGHAARGEQRKVLELTKPRSFIPIHGELRHLHAHSELAKLCGLDDARRFLVTDGDVVGIDGDGGRTLGRVPAGKHLMRREGVAPVSELSLQERRWLAETGAVFAVVVMQVGSGKILHGPVLHGQALQGDEMAAMPLATEGARKSLDDLSPAMRGDDVRVREEIIKGVRRVFKQLLGTKPTIIPMIVRLQ
jgi:ribonuclease J